MKLSYLVTVTYTKKDDRDDVAAALEESLDRIEGHMEDELEGAVTVEYEPTDEPEADDEDDEDEEEGFDEED